MFRGQAKGKKNNIKVFPLYIFCRVLLWPAHTQVRTQNSASNLGSLSLDLVTFTSPLGAFVQDLSKKAFLKIQCVIFCQIY